MIPKRIYINPDNSTWTTSSTWNNKIPYNLHKPKRTNQQNRYYWAVLACISMETGEVQETLHEYYKKKFLGFRNDILFGEPTEIPVSTRDLNTTEFTYYIEKIAIQISEFGIRIPRPEDKDFKEFLEYYKNYL